MATQTAIVVHEPGCAKLAKDLPIPELPEDYILVKTKAGVFPPPSTFLCSVAFYGHLD